MKPRQYKQSGLTLVELLVAMLLGLVLIGGALNVYLANSVMARHIDAVARMQESGRYAMELISRDLRMTGFSGCRAITSTASLNLSTVIATQVSVTGNIDLANRVEELDTSSGAEAFGSASGQVILDSNSHAIIVNMVSNHVGRLTADMASGTAPLTFALSNPDDAIEERDVIFASDCNSNSLFVVSGVSGDQLQHAVGEPTRSPYQNDSDTITQLRQNADLYRVTRNTYFIGPSPRPNNQNQQVNSLWISRNGGQAQELVEGVNRMQLLYGLDSEGDHYADRYVTDDDLSSTPGDPNSLENLVAIRIILQSHSVNTVGNQLLTRTYVRTVQLRNLELERI